MLIKPSIILAAAVLAAASLLSPFARADGTDPLMPTGTTFDPNPAAPNSPTNKVLVYGTDKDGTAVPMRTLRITNNTPNTVYPIMRDQNATVLADEAVGLYDPYDTPKREYRGYIGYQGTDKKYYFGLKRNQTILVSIPLVFWDAARMGIETGGGGQYLLHNQTKLPNPLRNDSNAARTIAKSEAGPGAITNGVVMWYRADTPTLAVAPADDTEDQLVEWTIRDHVYLSNPKITEQTKCTDATKCKIGKRGLLAAFLLGRLLDRQQHGDVDHLVEMARDPVELGEAVLAQGRSHFEVMTADRQVHGNPFGSAAGHGSRGAD